ncbi:hypothetical protein HN371_24940 [Candidatus Poribacteria bacterium]|nr:hypothetical protein [Candidatus Poribacteria bacterium]
MVTLATLLLGAGEAVATPETVLLSGPDGPTNLEDVVFWWTGVSDDPTAPLAGYRYSLDGAAAVFTTRPTATFYALTPGEHTFSVAAVGIDLTEDLTPAGAAFTVTGEFRVEVEPNNFDIVPTPLVSGLPTRATSLAADDADWYALAPALAPGQVTATFRRPDGGRGSTSVRVYRDLPAFGDLVLDASVTAATDHRLSATFGADAVPYYVHVQMDDAGQIGSLYTLTLTAEAPEETAFWDAEPNDADTVATRVAASDLTESLRVFGSTDAVGDVDWFRLAMDVTAPRLLRVTVARPGSRGSASVDAFAGSLPDAERQIALLDVSAANGQFATFETAVGLGDILIRVGHDDDVRDVPYALVLDMTDIPAGETYEVEPNGVDPRVNARSPNALTPNVTVVGQSWAPDADVDWFRVDIADPGVLGLTVERPGGRGSTTARLYNSNFLLVGEAVATAVNGQATSLSAIASAGSYYVELAPQGESPQAPYALTPTLESPGIFSAERTATVALTLGDVLNVRLLAPPGLTASFSIVGARLDVPMFDDGAHDDGDANDGHYVGSYVVRSTDELFGLDVTARVVDIEGAASQRVVGAPVTLDGRAPAPVTAVAAADAPDDDGGVILVQWTASDAADLAQYRVYVETTPITSVDGLTPALRASNTSARLSVESSGVALFVAVTAVDRAGSESTLAPGSVAGPVIAEDNRLPTPITAVSAEDIPDDYGGALRVRWTPAFLPDFAEYRVYAAPDAIEDVGALVPVARIAAPFRTDVDILDLPTDAEAFVAVTVLDLTGNESGLAIGSVAGPVVAAAQAATDASPLEVAGPIGILRGGSATFHWLRFPAGRTEPVADALVTLDGIEQRVVSRSSTTFHDLTPGRHTVRIVESASGVATTRAVHVDPLAPSETEPNDIAALAEPLHPNEAVAGSVANDSDWSRIESPAPGLVSVTVTRRSGSVELRVYRQAAAADTLAWTAALDDLTPRATFSVGTLGEPLLVEMRGDGGYELFTTWAPTPAFAFEREPNDTRGRATAAGVGVDTPRLRGSLTSDDDVDWFALPASTTGNVVVRAYTPDGGAMRLRVYREAEQVAALSFGTDEPIADLPLRMDSAAYFLAVDGDATGAEYQIAVAAGGPSVARELEPNGDLADATALPMDTSIVGDTWADGDRDVYGFDVPTSGVLVASLSRPAASTVTTARILAASGAELGLGITSGPTGVAYAQASVGPGAFYVAVDADGAEDAEYALHATLFGELAHDAAGTLKAGDEVAISLVWRPGADVVAELVDASGAGPRAVVPLVDVDGSGAYSATWTARDDDDGDDLVLRARVVAEGLTRLVTFPGGITVDTTPPDILSASHDARTALGVGATLHVTATAESGALGAFALLRPDGAAARADVPMEETEDGRYEGALVVGPTDDIVGGTVRVGFEDEVGNRATRDISRMLTLDTLPPNVASVTHDGSGVLVEGDRVGVTLRGDVGARGTFAILTESETPFRDDIPVFDDGAHADGDADDGVYRGEYTVRPGDIAEAAVVRGRLVDDAGNAATGVASATVSIDASTPTIIRASHDADAALALGDTLRIAVTGSPGATGSFSIARADGTFYRADLRLTETDTEGEYAASFDVGLGSDLIDGTVTVVLRKANGKSATRSITAPVTFDTTPPPAVRGVMARDVPTDEGGFIRVSWEATSAADFTRYEVYRSQTPLATVDGRAPEALDLLDRSVESVVLPAPTGLGQYFAVVAIDEAGNASGLSLDVGGSVSARVEAIDDLPPLPIRNVLALDRPNDGGGVLSVVWEPTPALDFAEYRVYVSDLPFLPNTPPRAHPDIPGVPAARLRAPSVTVADVPTPADGVGFFVAVSAVDASGNESAVGAAGVSGPATSQADGAPAPGGAFAVFGGPTSIARDSSLAFRWSRFGSTAGAIDNYRYSIDGGPGRFTGVNEALLTGLTAGEHVFSVAPADGGLPAATRRFHVDPISIPEREPNDAPDVAMSLPPGVAVDGLLTDGGDIDRYRVQLSAPAQVSLHLARVGVGVAQMTLTAPSVALEFSGLATISADGLAAPDAHTAMVLEAGEYVVRVTGDPGMYRAVVAAHPTPADIAWDLEPNDDPRRATRVFGDAAEISGASNREGDVDWYRVPIPADGFPIIELDLAQAAFHDTSRFEFLHDAPGAGQFGIGAVTLSPDEPTVRLRAGVRQGDLLIKAMPALGSVYGVRVGFAPLPPDVLLELEPNGDVDIAQSFSPGARVDAALWGADDVDWYRVDMTPTAGGFVALTVDAAERDAAVEAEAFTAGLQSLGALLPSASAPNAYAVTVPSLTRSFFVRVRGATTVYGLAGLAVSRAAHDATLPLGAGAELTVTVQGDEEWDVRAEIPGHGIEFPLTSTIPGTYVGAYTVEPGADVRDAAVEIVIDSLRGVHVRAPLTPTVTLDTVPPAISDARHSAGRPLRADGELRISARTEAGSRVSYEVEGGDFRVLGDMFDDGAHDDADPDDGVYSGVYRVQPGDAATGATVSVSATDAVGNARTLAISRPIDLDTTPPRIEQVAHSGVSVLREGDRLTVTTHGEAGARGAFSVEGVRENLPLVDDGTRGDDAAGDGVYVGSTLILPGDNTPGAIVTVRLTDLAGNEASAQAALPVSMDTAAPVIDGVTHSATGPLREGDRLVVRVTGEAGSTATFDIGAERTDIAMFDDGVGDDDSANDGVYTGAYVVRRDDDLPEAIVTARVADRNGNTGFRAATARVTLDAMPPPSVRGLSVEDAPDDQGNRVRLAWTAADGVVDFLRYHIYRETAPIRSTRGLTPVSTEIVNMGQEAVELDVPANNVDYHFAITAVDVARNESSLSEDGSSAFGPARATDDLPPASVLGVAAADAPEDDGGFLVVSWTSQSDETDFGGYAVFLDEGELESVPAREADLLESDRTVTQVLVPTAEDMLPVYVVVAARDINGSYSAVIDGSRAGPVTSTDDVAPQPVSGVAAVDAPGDEGGRLSVAWDVPADPTVVEFEVLLSSVPIRSSADLVGLEPAASAPRPADVEQDVAGTNAPTSGADGDAWHVAVVAVDGGGNRSEIAAASVDGPVRSVANVLAASRGALIQAGFDPQTSVRIPDSVARPGVRVDIYRTLDTALQRAVDEANLNLDVANIDDATEADLAVSVRHFDGSPTKFAQPLTVTVSFPPPDSSEVTRDLRLFRLNTDAIPARWDLVSGEQTVDVGQGVVSAESTTLGVFRVARLLLPTQLDRVTVAPNPFRPSHDGVLTMRNLTDDADVEIFTLDARRVTRLMNASSGVATWDGRSDSGVLVATGLYLYLVRAANDRRVGQILVIR